jgi:DNA repair ATPase RecN
LDVAELKEAVVEDEAIALVKSLQWADWTELRFAAPDSPPYRVAVAKLATRLAEANAAAERTEHPAMDGSSQDEPAEDDESGLVDRLAQMEEAMPRLVIALEGAVKQIERVATVANEVAPAIEDSDAKNKGFAGRLDIIRKLALDLGEPAGEILALGQRFTSELHQIDEGVRLLIEQAAQEAREDPNSVEAACQFFDMVRQLTFAAEEGLGSLAEMIDSMAPVEQMSRDLRPVLRNMRQGLTLFVEGRDVMREWTRLVDSSPVGCEEIRPSSAPGSAGG